MAAPEAAASGDGDDATGSTSLDQLLRRAAEARARRRRAGPEGGEPGATVGAGETPPTGGETPPR